MISIQSSLTELEKRHKLLVLLLECYTAAIRNVSHYALELDEEAARQFRQHLDALARGLSVDSPEAIADSRATLRGLLRENRDRNSAFVAGLRDELASTARALEEILDSLHQSDDEHEGKLRSGIAKLRSVAGSDTSGGLGAAVSAAADSIERCVEQMRKQHQLTVSQFLAEIRVLHRRIDALETAASLDEMARLSSRTELMEWIRLSTPGEYCLLLVGARGLLRAEVQFGKDVGVQLSAAFAKRLRNSLPPTARAVRWSAEEFIALAGIKKAEALTLGKWIGENLSGTYACLQGGNGVRPCIQTTVGVVDTTAKESTERILQRVELFFGGGVR